VRPSVHTHTYSDGNCDGYSDCYINCDGYTHADINAETDTHTAGCSYAAAAPNRATAPIAFS
jgi:hypothetical protein